MKQSTLNLIVAYLKRILASTNVEDMHRWTFAILRLLVPDLPYHSFEDFQAAMDAEVARRSEWSRR